STKIETAFVGVPILIKAIKEGEHFVTINKQAIWILLDQFRERLIGRVRRDVAFEGRLFSIRVVRLQQVGDGGALILGEDLCRCFFAFSVLALASADLMSYSAFASLNASRAAAASIFMGRSPSLCAGLFIMHAGGTDEQTPHVRGDRP